MAYLSFAMLILCSTLYNQQQTRALHQQPRQQRRLLRQLHPRLPQVPQQMLRLSATVKTSVGILTLAATAMVVCTTSHQARSFLYADQPRKPPHGNIPRMSRTTQNFTAFNHQSLHHMILSRTVNIMGGLMRLVLSHVMDFQHLFSVSHLPSQRLVALIHIAWTKTTSHQSSIASGTARRLLLRPQRRLQLLRAQWKRQLVAGALLRVDSATAISRLPHLRRWSMANTHVQIKWHQLGREVKIPWTGFVM